MYEIQANLGQGWEDVDTADDLEEAEFLTAEYVLAFNTMRVRYRLAGE